MMIANNKIPIVVLFGPPACGKTMTLIRLCHYLRTIGYKIRLCKGEINLECLTIAAVGSIYDNLVEVIDSKGQLKLYVYEAPGDWYMRQNQYPFSLVSLLSSLNPKIWCFFTEPNYADAHGREEYVQSIKDVYRHFVRPRSDKSIIVYNKIDDTPFMISNQIVQANAARQDVNNKYPSLFDIFRNHSILSKWFILYNVMFVPFMTGYFTKQDDEYGNMIVFYSVGPDIFPAKLWESFSV